MKPRIFIILNHYLPGYKAGGPQRTIANMVAQLGDQFEFWILTKDRDATDTQPYQNVQINAWNRVGPSMVYYAAPGAQGMLKVRQLIGEVLPHAIYLNSFFANGTIRCLLLRRLGLLPRLPVLLAPRGELSPGALGLKAFKKRLYMQIAMAAGLYQDLTWQATAENESDDIRREIGAACQMRMVPNLGAKGALATTPTAVKHPGATRLVFISRITPKKNLHAAIEMLRRITGEVVLDIYGPIRDEAYWKQCSDLIATLPANISVSYRGAIEHDRVATTLAGYHFFLLPTLGENFGHAILEALAAGCPVLLSDQTPWRNLETHHAGWDIALAATDAWQRALAACVAMDETAYREMSCAAQRLASDFIASPQIAQDMTTLFEDVIARPAMIEVA